MEVFSGFFFLVHLGVSILEELIQNLRKTSETGRLSLKQLAAKNMARNTFDLDRYLREHKAFIDHALGCYLKTDHKKSLLHQAVCYSVLDGGKRFRPILTLAAGELFGAKRRVLLSFACAIELIHLLFTDPRRSTSTG